ncbi:MAG TPA: hypothetical protein VMH33_11970 [Solirubrobacterales bacterium]|nr:hypothetical protein [Solirubrobacterales bacterium]
MAGGDPVDGIGVVRDADAAGSFQLVTKSYRPRPGDRGGRGDLGQPLRQGLRAHHRGLPDAAAIAVVERDEDLAAIAVEDRQPGARDPGGGDPGSERVERRDAAAGQAEADRQAFRGRDPDPQAGERPRPETDRDEVDRPPAAGRVGTALDLGEQPGRVSRPAPLGEPEVGLGDDLTVAPGAGGGVRGRGVEADDDQDALT